MQPAAKERPAKVSPVPSLMTARFLALAAAVLWSTSGLFAKAPGFQGWPGPLLAFWRAAFACVVLFPLVRKPQWSWRLLPAVAAFALMNYTYLTAMAKGSAANAIWLQYTAPAWALVAGVCFFRERAVGRDWLLLTCVIAGVAIIVGCESVYGDDPASLEAVFYGLAAGVFYAGVVLSLRRLRDFESAWIVSLNHLVTAIVLSPFLFDWSGGGLEIKYWPSGMQWLLLAGFGIVQMGLPYVLFARSVKAISAHEASGIGLVEPILVPLWVWLAWQSAPAWWTLVGGGLIFAGLVLRYASSGDTSPALPPPA